MLPLAVGVTGVSLLALAAITQGVSASVVIAACFVIASVLIAERVGIDGWRSSLFGVAGSMLFTLMSLSPDQRGAGLEAQLGLGCAGFELAATVPAIAAAIFVVRRYRKLNRPAILAAGAITGAMVGQAARYLLCSQHGLGHLVLFHTGPVVLVALVAALSSLLLARTPS